jgi:diguanylate cyclase (GGDEF)-like protein
LEVICILVSLLVSYRIRNRELSELSDRDALTNIYNRRAGERLIRGLMKQGRAGMFVLFDVDKFKSINDTYGHGVGDLVLKTIAEGFMSVRRNDDVVMRFGGDEYAGFATDVVDEESGIARIEALFEVIETIDLPELEGRRINISLGAALFSTDTDIEFDDLYKAADKGAYESKKKPGNTYTFCRAEKNS